MRESGPKAMLTRPRSMKAMAMVSITPANWGCPTIWRMMRASSSQLNAAASSTVVSVASQNGQPSPTIRPQPTNDEAMSTSPCAKLRTSVAL